MKRSILVCTFLVCALGGAATAVCAAQAYTPPPPPLTTLPPCPVDKNVKKRAKRTDCDLTAYPSETREKGTEGKRADAPTVAPPADGTATQKFPFPGEQPAASPPAVKKFPFPGESTGDVPGDKAAADKKAAETPAGKAFPFPGEGVPEAPSDAAGSSQRPDESSSSSSSSSGSSSSSEPTSESSSNEDTGGVASKTPASKNPDDDDEEPPKLKNKESEGRRSKKVVKPQTDTERVDEDLSVAKFYGQSGNEMGAYLRAKDAVKIQPEFPDGHFVLGEAAMRLNKKDEAVAEFQTYLKLAPDGTQVMAAEKALDGLK